MSDGFSGPPATLARLNLLELGMLFHGKRLKSLSKGTTWSSDFSTPAQSLLPTFPRSAAAPSHRVLAEAALFCAHPINPNFRFVLCGGKVAWCHDKPSGEGFSFGAGFYLGVLADGTIMSERNINSGEGGPSAASRNSASRSAQTYPKSRARRMAAIASSRARKP